MPWGITSYPHRPLIIALSRVHLIGCWLSQKIPVFVPFNIRFCVETGLRNETGNELMHTEWRHNTVCSFLTDNASCAFCATDSWVHHRNVCVSGCSSRECDWGLCVSDREGLPDMHVCQGICTICVFTKVWSCDLIMEVLVFNAFLKFRLEAGDLCFDQYRTPFGQGQGWGSLIHGPVWNADTGVPWKVELGNIRTIPKVDAWTIRIAVWRETKMCPESVWSCLTRCCLFWWTI